MNFYRFTELLHFQLCLKGNSCKEFLDNTRVLVKRSDGLAGDLLACVLRLQKNNHFLEGGMGCK